MFFRVSITPIFSSGKLKQMYSIMQKCSDHLESMGDLFVNKDAAFDTKELVHSIISLFKHSLAHYDF